MTRMGLLAVVCLLAAQPVVAQPAVSLTIDEAVARALAHAPRLAEVRARERAAEATRAAYEAAGRPSVSALTGFVRTNHVDEFGLVQPDGTRRIIFPDIPSNYRVRAEIGVPLVTGGRVDALVASAEAERRAVAAESASVEADIELETVVAYWTLALARARVDVLEQAQRRADAVVSDVAARVETGLLPPNEQLSAEAQRARQRVQLIEAQNAAAVAEAQLARLVGVEPGQPIDPTTPVAGDMTIAGEVGDPSVLAREAARRRAERQALGDRAAAAEAAARAAAAALRPQLTALAAIEPARPNARFVPRVDEWNTSWDLGVTLSWSLFDGGRSRAERAAALARAEAIRAAMDDFDAAVDVDVRARQADVAAARAGLAAAAEAVAAAREARRVVGERFEAGVATTTDVLDADVALLEAELEQTRLAVALRIGQARLMRSAGIRR